jgi:hypothetical protein
MRKNRFQHTLSLSSCINQGCHSCHSDHHLENNRRLQQQSVILPAPLRKAQQTSYDVIKPPHTFKPNSYHSQQKAVIQIS